MIAKYFILPLLAISIITAYLLWQSLDEVTLSPYQGEYTERQLKDQGAMYDYEVKNSHVK